MAALSLMVAATLTSCEDILGHWERPTAVTPSGGDAPTPAFDPLATPLTIEAKDYGVEVKLVKGAINVPAGDIYYKVNDNPWKVLTFSDGFNGDFILLNNAGDKVSFWSKNANMADGGTALRIYIRNSEKAYAYGNVMSLIDDQATSVDAPKFSEDTEIGPSFALKSLFYGQANLLSHPEKKLVLPATTLTKGCLTPADWTE